MSSIIQTLLQKYRRQVEQREQFLLEAEEHAGQLERLEKVAECFMDIIVLLCCSDERAQSISAKGLKKSTAGLIQAVCEDRRIGANLLKRVVGQYIAEEFASNAYFSGLKNEFALIYEDEEEEEEPAQEVSNIFDEEEDVNMHNFLRELTTSSEESRFNIPKSQCKQEVNLSKLSETWGNNPHEMQVLTYLIELSAPQSELSYLCQEMNWKLDFLQQKDEDLYNITTQVDFAFKSIRATIKESYKAKTKKQGRLVSSFKVLRRIYINYPEIWHLYEDKKIKKSLVLQKNPNSELKSLHSEVLVERVQPISMVKEEKDEQFQKDKNRYISEISNFKSELNLLIQQIPGIFSFKTDKMQIDGPGSKWKVKGELNIKLRGEEKDIESSCVDKNSKIGEQRVAKEVIMKLYDSYKEILIKMITIKKKKNIKI